MRKRIGCGLIVAGLAASLGSAQTKITTIDLPSHGQMTKAELDAQYPLPAPPPEEKGFLTSGPVGGIAWWGVGAAAVDRQGNVYVGLPLWGDRYAPKSALRGEGNKLRVLVIDPKGETTKTMDFPATSLNRVDLRIAPDGSPLVLAGDKWMRVGPDGKPTATLDIPNEEKEYEVWDVFASATGRTLRLIENQNHALFVNADTLAILKDCRTDNHYYDEGTLTDDMELSEENISQPVGYARELFKQPFCSNRDQVEIFGKIDFQPVALNDTHFIAIADKQMALRKLSGETVWTIDSPPGLAFDTYQGHEPLSLDGKRIAVRLYRSVRHQGPTNDTPQAIQNGTWRGKVEMVNVEDSIGVWDAETGKMIGKVVLPGHTEFRHYDPEAQFALSPDGKILAIVEDTHATVWRVP
jgi:hypothetical protein